MNRLEPVNGQAAGSAPSVAQVCQQLAAPPEPSPGGLSTLERVVLSACTNDPQPAKVIARKCHRSLNRVREAIASLIAKGLLERMARWELRRRRHQHPRSAGDRNAAVLTLLLAAVQLLSGEDAERGAP